MTGGAVLALSFTTLLCALRQAPKEVLGRVVLATIIALILIIPVSCEPVMVPTSAKAHPGTIIADLTEIPEIAEFQPMMRTVRSFKPKTSASRPTWLAASLVVLEARLVKSAKPQVRVSPLPKHLMMILANACLQSWAPQEPTSRLSSFCMRTSRPRKCVEARVLHKNNSRNEFP